MVETQGGRERGSWGPGGGERARGAAFREAFVLSPQPSPFSAHLCALFPQEFRTLSGWFFSVACKLPELSSFPWQWTEVWVCTRNCF